MENMASAVARLPLEMLLEILYFLDGKSISRCCLVCRLWREAVEASTELKYALELWADGLVPGYPDRLSPMEKLQKLYRWRRAWENIDWTSRTVLPIGPDPRAYELVGGVFALQNTWPESDFTTMQLPSAESGARISTAPNVGVASLDFAMDPTQDLVVFLHQYPEEVGNFECRTLSTLQPHPLALTPRLSFALRDDHFRRIFLQVADDIVGLLFRTSSESGFLRLVLFNWRTGETLTDIVGQQFPPFISDFALLFPRAYILACATDGKYGGRPIGTGEIHIHTFDGTRRNHPVHVATLQLPQIHSNRCLDRIIAHSGPFCANPLPAAQFSKSNDKRICVISLVYDEEEYYTLYVHHRYLEKLLLNKGAPLTIPWDDWGPRNSRMLRGRHRFWLRYVHGERVVCPVNPSYPTRVEILDFGITPSRPGVDSTSIMGPSTIPKFGNVFRADVTTSLPYRRVFRDLGDRHLLFLIDQDRLIGVNDLFDTLTVYAF
ncbi:hypothetical protein DFH06DRAFT_1184348 [Mycena polygramma]|nr:hypothetical protein DFH06DRAFT_1184348 [Mycena polygramma]